MNMTGRYLTGLLDRLSLAQNIAAKRIGCSATLLSDIKLGKRSLTPEMIHRVARLVPTTERDEVSADLHFYAARDAGYDIKKR